MTKEENLLLLFQTLKSIEENLKEFEEERKKMSYKETSPKETKENVNLVTLGKRSPFSLPAAKELAFREETLASLQGSLEFLSYGVPCMNQEMHEEEK